MRGGAQPPGNLFPPTLLASPVGADNHGQASTGAEIPTGDPNPAGRNVTGLCADDGPTARAPAPGRGQVELLQADERKAVLAALAAARAALDAGDALRARAAIVALERRLEAAGEGEGAATA